MATQPAVSSVPARCSDTFIWAKFGSRAARMLVRARRSRPQDGRWSFGRFRKVPGMCAWASLGTVRNGEHSVSVLLWIGTTPGPTCQGVEIVEVAGVGYNLSMDRNNGFHPVTVGRGSFIEESRLLDTILHTYLTHSH